MINIIKTKEITKIVLGLMKKVIIEKMNNNKQNRNDIINNINIFNYTKKK